MSIGFILNGERRSVEADERESLQRVLQRMGIHSVRDSDDGDGFTGSDTILLDGKPVLAGLMSAGQARDHAIDTVESLMPDGKLSLIQSAMLDAGAVQSAYNSPAAALLLADLMKRVVDPTEDDVRDALSGLYSRSTGYLQFLDAVRLARMRMKDAMAAPLTVPEFGSGLRVAGKMLRRVDGFQLAAGRAAFVEDRVEPGACRLLMLGSPHAHAYIRDIDASAAEKLPGVIMVLSYKNCPDRPYCQAGQGFPEPTPYDHVLFPRKVRYVGDRVAAVVAVDSAAAEAALKLLKVSYDPLPPVLSLEDAASGRLPAVHGGPALLASGETAAKTAPNADPREGRIIYQLSIGADPAANCAASASGSVGDVEKGFAEADVVIERTYSTSRVQCTPLEPHVVYTRMEGDRLIIHASTQVPWHMRRIVASVLGIGENRVRVIKERVGGGFGAKQDIVVEDVCAYATFKTGRPVFWKYTREEEFSAATTRHPFRFTMKLGARRDGKLTAVSMRGESDQGAYGNHCLTVPMNSCSKSLPLFPCANTAFAVKSRYTNHVPAGAYQGYGAPQGSFAVQLAAAELAAELGMSHLDFIRKNMVRDGDSLDILAGLGEGRPGSAVRVQGCGLGRALEEGLKLIDWDARTESPDKDIGIGRGVAVVQQGSGLPGLDQACAQVTLLSGGTFLVRSGGADLGTGLDTVVAKLAAERLQCGVDAVTVVSGDTDITPFDKGAYASSGTFFSGNAALKAAEDLSAKMLAAAAQKLKAPRGGVEPFVPRDGPPRQWGRHVLCRACHLLPER